MKFGQPALSALCAVFLLLGGGCAINGGSAPRTISLPVTERDQLAEAAQKVEKTSWPKPEPAPMLGWLTGKIAGGDDRFTKSDAIDYYVSSLPPHGSFDALMSDAAAKLDDASLLHHTAMLTASAARVTARDVAVVENAIKTLREQRDIYSAAADRLEDAGVEIDDDEVDTMRRRFRLAVKALGDAADILAEIKSRDRSELLATPTRNSMSDFSGL